MREEEVESLNKKDLDGCIEEIEHLEDMGIKVIDIDSPLYPQILNTLKREKMAREEANN